MLGDFVLQDIDEAGFGGFDQGQLILQAQDFGFSDLQVLQLGLGDIAQVGDRVVLAIEVQGRDVGCSFGQGISLDNNGD